MTTAQHEPWTLTASRYQAMMGVHQPWIAEISPYQYASMSKRGKATYDAKRSREWDASASCKRGYRAEVVAAYDAGRITLDTPMTDDAKHAILDTLIDRDQAAKAEAFDNARRQNRIRNIEDIRVGDRVFVICGGRYGIIRKINKVSVTIEVPGWERAYTHKIGSFDWLSYQDLKDAAESGTPVTPQRGQ